MERKVYEVIKFEAEVKFDEVKKGEFRNSGNPCELRDGLSQDNDWDYCNPTLIKRFDNELEAIDFLRESCNASVEPYKSNGLMIIKEAGVFEMVYDDEEVDFSNAHDLERKFNEMVDEAIRYDVDINKEDIGDCYPDDLLEIRDELSRVRWLSEVDEIYEKIVDYLKGFEK